MSIIIIYSHDYFSVDVLLKAADVDLDAIVRGRPIRDGGIVASIQIGIFIMEIFSI